MSQDNFLEKLVIEYTERVETEYTEQKDKLKDLVKEIITMTALQLVLEAAKRKGKTNDSKTTNAHSNC